MPAVASRGGGRRRRAMGEINMVPFIDVMLVLLIIFMVSAPLITTGVVDLPSVGKAQQRPLGVIEIVVGADEKLKMRVDQGEAASVSLNQLAARAREAQAGNEQVPVVISADRNVKYDVVMRVMDRLQQAGIKRIGLSVRQGG